MAYSRDLADMDYHGLSWTVIDCYGLTSWIVMDCHGLSWIVMDYPRLELALYREDRL